MKLSFQTLFVAVLPLVSSAPIADAELDERQLQLPCLLPQITQLRATQLVNRYSAVIAQLPSDLGSAAQTANLIVDSSYSEQSDSANIQLGIPLGQLTTPSKQVFVTKSQSSPPVVAKTIAVYVAGCNSVLWQWRSTNFGSGQYPVQGFHLFQLDNLGLIRKTFFEFNSIAGALDIGYTVFNEKGVKLGPNNV